MEVIEVKAQGFCQGVAKAIEKAQKALESDHRKPIYILGSLVHNRFVNESLEQKGARILENKGTTRLELLDKIDHGTVIFTAHGVSDKVRAKAEQKGLETIDASCPFVLATQKLIAKETAAGSVLFYIGKKGHPEAEGALEDCTRAWLIEREEDIPEGIEEPIFVTNQTTMSVLEIEHLFDAIRNRYPEAKICSELCNATRIRQQAVLDLKDSDIDLLVVVGDPASNNTAKLADAGKSAGIKRVLCVESASQIDPEACRGCRKAAVTSGASTPGYLKDEVTAYLRSLTD